MQVGQTFLATITILSAPPGGGEHPEHPMVPPGGYPKPEHPIVYPPPGGGNGGSGELPTHPIVPPGGYPKPEHPIVLPPTTPPDAGQPPTGPLGAVEWHTVWTEQYGWAIIGLPTGDHVAPSRKK
jgi:hypothetical protein